VSGPVSRPEADPGRPDGPGPAPGGLLPPGAQTPAYLDMGIGRFVAELSAATPDPGGGATAALAVTLAAGLCVMTARLSGRHLPAEELAARAGLLRDRAAPLAQADAEAYRAVIAALRAPGRAGVPAALSAACAVPMQVAEIGAEVAALAAAVAAGGNPNVRGDAITAALLAAAGARAAAALVRINLTGAEGDDRPARAEHLAAEAARLASGAEADHASRTHR
jgi:methenyltetrahydrofolate cyclohydrolase